MLKCIGDWPVTFLINSQMKAGLITSPLRLFGPRGLGQGLAVFVLSFCQTCMIHCHLTRENKAEEWGISGPKGLFLQHTGLYYKIQRGDMTHFLENLLLWTLFQAILVSNLQGESLQTAYKALSCVCSRRHIFFWLYPNSICTLKRWGASPNQAYIVVPLGITLLDAKKEMLITYSVEQSSICLLLLSISLILQKWCVIGKDPKEKKKKSI